MANVLGSRPLGANLGDWLGSPSGDGGLGLGTAVTSVIFLAAILATVVYLTLSRSDVIETQDLSEAQGALNPARERIMLGYYAVVAVATAAHDHSRHSGQAQCGRSARRDHPADRPGDRLGRRPAQAGAEEREARPEPRQGH
ncbi:hypothetical protein ACFYZB_01850 [Streptomyces sp. NPDC001852]|uniref:hypothetical protein n=1 Tax=Streptomyces sp. NPDC001852 TaxID=3364619 RepID=UPI003683B848